MANQENVRITRAAKRRSAEEAWKTEEMPVPKKRVVLGELTNVSNVVVSGNADLGNEPHQRKSRANAKTKKALVRMMAPITKRSKIEEEETRRRKEKE